MTAPLPTVICLGAGPAGLTAAYLLSKKGYKVTLLEQDPVYVGGISKTVSYKGYHCDIGGHRFFTKSEEVNQLWDEILGDDFLERPRKSRIYYKKKLFDYPLSPMDAFFKLGVFETIRCVLSYLKARLFLYKNPKNFEEWVVNQFGRRLFHLFFKSYTEKVWGMDCSEISADWAAQRIKGLSLFSAIKHALFPKSNQSGNEQVIKTLIHQFRYPRKGPGMMWEAARDKVINQGGVVIMDANVTGLSLDRKTRKWTVSYQSQEGKSFSLSTDHVISSIPLRQLIGGIEPKAKPNIIDAASSLSYRDFLVVGLIIKEQERFDDNWIYIHDPDVQVGRIQNFKSWSPEMVPDATTNCLGMEYFCFEGDGLWNRKDDALVKQATDELIMLGLAKEEEILDGFVIRQKKAYPVYDDHYKSHLAQIKETLKEDYPNLHVVGRNGMHQYNNQDHAMMTAMLTVKNITEGGRYDVWNVTEDAEYLEEARLVPRKAVSS